MQHIIDFLIRYRNLLLYLLLLLVSLIFTIQSHNYHRNSFISSSSAITGSILDTRDGFYEYLDLKNQNRKLNKENALLRERLSVLNDTLGGASAISYLSDSIPYNIISSRVIKNDYRKRDNYLTIRSGTNHGVTADMGVIGTQGLVGIVDVASSRFARVISILNSNISLNAQIKSTNVIGSLTWDGTSPYIMNLVDVPRLARVKAGDSIITGQFSNTFPPDILIGTVAAAQLVDNGSRYSIKVKLINDMTDIGEVKVIKSRDAAAIKIIDTLRVNE